MQSEWECGAEKRNRFYMISLLNVLIWACVRIAMSGEKIND